MPHEKRSYKRVPTKLIVLWEGLSTNNIALMTNISLVRILMMVNSDSGEREHAPAGQTLVVSFYS